MRAAALHAAACRTALRRGGEGQVNQLFSMRPSVHGARVRATLFIFLSVFFFALFFYVSKHIAAFCEAAPLLLMRGERKALQYVP